MEIFHKDQNSNTVNKKIDLKDLCVIYKYILKLDHDINITGRSNVVVLERTPHVITGEVT